MPAENQGFKARLKELAGWETMEVQEREKKANFGKIKAESLYVTLVCPTSLAKMV